jgi:hypothetical protein
MYLEKAISLFSAYMEYTEAPKQSSQRIGRLLPWPLPVPGTEPVHFTRNARLSGRDPAGILRVANMKSMQIASNREGKADFDCCLRAPRRTKEQSMKLRRDYSCEIMGIVVLTVLSALSHFWFILIFVGIVAGVAVLGLVMAAVLIGVGRRLLARLLNPVPQQISNSEKALAVEVSQRPSLPIA